MKKVIMLGATGSIGTSALDIVRQYPRQFKIIGMSANQNLDKMAALLEEFQPSYAVIGQEDSDFTARFPNVNFDFGEQGLLNLIKVDTDIIIIGIAGMAGLLPTLASIRNDISLLSANKESIVAAGDLIMSKLKKAHLTLLPLDSEHNAIFNQMIRFKKDAIHSIFLTASGGPFLRTPITPQTTKKEVLKHPTWEMGQYITVNSATLMNKGFEVIEAHHLFDMPYNRINVIVHPQSLIHGGIETIDGSQFITLSPSDMRYPIALSMFYPKIPENRFVRHDISTQNLEFEKPDLKRFPLLKLAYKVGNAGGILPAVLNAANEIAVNAFLNDRIRFMDIPVLVSQTVESFENQSSPDLETILETDMLSRKKCLNRIGKYFTRK